RPRSRRSTPAPHAAHAAPPRARSAARRHPGRSQEIHLSLNPHERGTVPLVRDPVAVALVALGLTPLDERHTVRLVVEDVEAPAHAVTPQLPNPVAVVRVLR